MKFLFWFCLMLTAYAYVGYAVLLSLIARLGRKPVAKGSLTPFVSLVMAACNEETNLPRKLQNLRSVDYPRELLQIVVASDGSKDATADVLRAAAGDVVPVILEQSVGKASALNTAVRHATGEILVFLDVRQTVSHNAVRELVSCFADPQVGAVSGELLLESATGEASGSGLGIYWIIEKIVRKLESATGSVVGVTGAIYAIRRELYVDIPPGTILDDVFVPMQVAKQGKRVIFEPAATATDRIFSEKGKEFSRKVRTLTGNYQLLRLAPWLLSPANPLLFRFISHKLLRLLVPLLLVGTLLSSAVPSGPFFRAVFLLQIAFYMLAAGGAVLPAGKRFKPIAIAHTFVMLNAAAAVAFYNFILGRKRVWVR